MNYKETLYFVAKCLTISLEDKNRDEIELVLKRTDVDWDAVVKVSTAHYVFPAIYCNFKRADFLKYLPIDLVDYMKYITNLNRERNKKIISQAQELNSVLLANKIRPIFLKGTGNLLAGIYRDIGERMVGDIDFIFSKEDYPKTIIILREFGYSEVNKQKYYPPDKFRHYRRLQKENKIAAIEIHKDLLIRIKYTNEFNYSFVAKDSQIINDVAVLSYTNKLNLSIIANQINDNGFYYKTMALRNAYDVFLLSKKTDAMAAVNTIDKLRHPLNCFLAACFEIFNQADSLRYNPTAKTESYLNGFNSHFTNPIKTQSPHIKIYLFTKKGLSIILKSIIYKEYRVWVFNVLTDKNWYKEKIIQLGIKS
ncbi:nucleotidyltransferase family protein [Flavobacteriaceae bacterium]|nr:nucleotidyltransferase family protein [Flavobacteriaceae bacterium]MDB4048490.1 nucleotidyltransferase family protein [Polaribacter sp.]